MRLILVFPSFCYRYRFFLKYLWGRIFCLSAHKNHILVSANPSSGRYQVSAEIRTAFFTFFRCHSAHSSSTSSQCGSITTLTKLLYSEDISRSFEAFSFLMDIFISQTNWSTLASLHVDIWEEVYMLYSKLFSVLLQQRFYRSHKAI